MLGLQLAPTEENRADKILLQEDKRSRVKLAPTEENRADKILLQEDIPCYNLCRSLRVLSHLCA